MNLQSLCTNCLTGTLRDGICTHCKKNGYDPADRPVNALPDRYMLGSQYYLGKVIGNGGFGITYLALDCQSGNRVIVKELYPKLDVQRDRTTGMITPVQGQETYYHNLKQRFREEAQVLHSFRNEPSVVNVYRLMEENNTVYYSMEYLLGVDLKAYMKQKGVLEWKNMSGYVENILHTLHLLHERGMIHRDISPDNIFLTGSREAKLIDFGSVRSYNNGQGLTTILKGAFAPIEQFFIDGNQGPWTDIYSLSVTIYYVLSGKLPPKAPERVLKDDVTDLHILCPNLPEYVSRSVMKGMSPLEKNRFQCVEEMEKALFPAGEDRSGYTFRCIGGKYHGMRFSLTPGGKLSVGRAGACDVCYPGDSPGISRRHFSLQCDADGKLIVRDDGSSYGTYVSNYRLEPGKWYQLNRGNQIAFTGERYVIE